MRNRAIRWFWISAGSLALSLGVLGIFLPLLPTVPFLLLAAFCFSRGSLRLHAWLMKHPVLGQPINDWNQRRVIGKRAKVFSSATILGGIFSVSYFMPEALAWLKVVLILIMLAVITFILRLRSV